MNNRIQVENPMRVAAREGVSEYQPVFRDIALEMEDQITPEASAAISMRNLRALRKAGLVVKMVECVENYHVLVTFTTSETYLALGFQIGTQDYTTKYFGQFLSEVFGGTAENWFKQLGPELYAPDWMGRVFPMVGVDANLKIHG